MINRRKFNYLSLKNFLFSIIIITFTVISLIIYVDLRQVNGLKPAIILFSVLLFILFNLETILLESKYHSLYYNVSKIISLFYYMCFSAIIFKYLISFYEN